MESNPEGDHYQGYLYFLLNDIAVESFTVDIAIYLLVLFFFLFCSALVSGAEVAFFSLGQKDLEDLKDKDDRSSTLVLHLLERPRQLLATILIANNLFNISIIILAYYIISLLLSFNGNVALEFLVNTVIVTFIIVLFGEVIPKVYANQKNIAFAQFISKPLEFLRRMFKPLSMILVMSTKIIEKRLKSTNNDAITREEIDHAIDIAADETTTTEEINILKGIVKFGNITVKQIMRPRMDIVAIDIESNFDELKQTVIDSGYSRIPVFEENLDNIEGILYAKDMLQFLDEQENFQWAKILRPPFFVPEYKKIEDLLAEFRSKRIHLAVVVDEYGGTAGIVSLEDIMEEIIGEIRDEFDEPEEEFDYQQLNDNTYIFEGKILINDFCKIIGVKPEIFDEVIGEADSLAGLLLEITKKIPDQNEEITFENFRFIIHSVSKKRIQRIKVIIEEDEDLEDQ